MKRRTHNQLSAVARSAHVWGGVDADLGKSCDAHPRFVQHRPQLADAQWREYTDAYVAGYTAVCDEKRKLDANRGTFGTFGTVAS